MAATLLIVFLNGAILAAFFVYFRRRIVRYLASGDALEEVKREIGRMVVDINETTERNIALIEERIARMNGLLAEADRRIVVLKKESERSLAKDGVYANLRPRPAPVAKEAEPGVRAKSPREEVLDLHDQGMEPRLIASKLNKTLGEVELIISLGERRR